MKNISIVAKSGASTDPPKSSGINRDEWLKALNDAGLMEQGDPNALTVTEFAAMFDLKPTSAKRRLAILVESGRAKQTRKRIQDSSGRMVVVNAYRLEGR